MVLWVAVRTACSPGDKLQAPHHQDEPPDPATYLLDAVTCKINIPRIYTVDNGMC